MIDIEYRDLAKDLTDAYREIERLKIGINRIGITADQGGLSKAWVTTELRGLLRSNEQKPRPTEDKK